MDKERILVGSRAFFDGLPNFKPHDSDYVELYNPEEVSFTYKNVIKEGRDCLFQLVRRPKQERIDYALAHERPFSLCMFLVPRVWHEPSGLGTAAPHARKPESTPPVSWSNL